MEPDPIPLDTIRRIHDEMDIPVKRQFEKALVLPILGIGKVTMPKVDLFEVKRRHVLPNEKPNPSDGLRRQFNPYISQVAVDIPITEDKSYRLIVAESLQWTPVDNGKTRKWRRSSITFNSTISRPTWRTDFSGLMKESPHNVYTPLHDTTVWIKIVEEKMVMREEVVSMTPEWRPGSSQEFFYIASYKGDIQKDLRIDLKRCKPRDGWE